MERFYKIADLNVKMDVFGRIAEFALPYQIEGCEMPDMVMERDWREKKKQRPWMTDENCLYNVTGGEFAYKLADFQGMILHASTVVMEEKAYLFSADSGVGKSTHTALWRQTFGDERIRILNDDKPALRLIDGVWYAYGTPWCGKYGWNLNLRYPIAGICFLKRGSENKIRRYKKDDIVFQFLKQTYRIHDKMYREKVLSCIESLIMEVPVWEMECNMEKEAARMSYEAMAMV